jgi:hypothetical protein
VYKLVRKEALPVDIQLLLFYSMIEPILIYGSEVWGYGYEYVCTISRTCSSLLSDKITVSSAYNITNNL